MNDNIKVLENLTEFLYSEINRCSMVKDMPDKSYAILRDAAIDAINLKRKLQDARAWAIQPTTRDTP